MLQMHQYLGTTPFDLYELHLFQLVVKCASFTRAAQVAGITQSAITRQIQGMEQSLGLTLLERTTRTVRPTDAGRFLYEEATRLVGDVAHLFQRLREDYAGARKEVRVGVSRSISLAYLPGFFHANLRRSPEVAIRVSYESSETILSRVGANEIDVGVICPGRQTMKRLEITHQFEDVFALIAPISWAADFQRLEKDSSAAKEWLRRQNWLLLEEQTNTGQQLRNWLQRQNLRVDPIMQLDNFDLIINLVALGMGLSLVPVRALALYGSRRAVARLKLSDRFARELAVVVRKRRKMPAHVSNFVANILF
jgi:DNA-binding transcriptional LysR family regulator